MMLINDNRLASTIDPIAFKRIHRRSQATFGRITSRIYDARGNFFRVSAMRGSERDHRAESETQREDRLSNRS